MSTAIVHERIDKEAVRLLTLYQPYAAHPPELMAAITYVTLLNVAAHYQRHDYESQALIKQLKDL